MLNPCQPCGAAQQAATAAAAVGRVVVAAITGEAVRVAAGVMEARLGECRARVGECCIEVAKPSRMYHRCAVCTCWLDGKYVAKAALATEPCPRGHWPE